MADIHGLKIKLLISFMILCGSAISANAQLFSPLLDNNRATAENQNKPQNTLPQPKTSGQVTRPERETRQQPTNTPSQNISKKEDKPEQPNRIVKFRFVGDEIVFEDKPAIILYMKNFRISKDIRGLPNCSMDFYILSSAKEKITAINYQLKWPNMHTVVTFEDVLPQTPTYVSYTLLGEGCRDMDQVPNIIVNRCRIKGMSSRECADAIQWMN